MTGNEIRTTFLDYFRKQDHTIVPSSSLVPAGDSTLLFTNAGMVQFKEVFLGLEKRPYRRATTAQKCVRAGGKHNDLDTVGRTARHHTFFEMLGNFSFGDYFKKEAISFAWEFLTRELDLPADRLWVTIYEDDREAAELWQQVAGVPAERIIALGEKDNFWSMGDTGPCGPCSEIIYDRGEAFSCGPSCGLGRCDCDRWLEIWNLVFMQFDRDASGHLSPLPRPSIDTGMGLERIASVLQNVDSNFDTDLLRPLIDAVSRLAGKGYVAGPEGFPWRVIADHARACTFLIADGVVPGNEGRGYVLRRILRRAVRFGRKLAITQPFFYHLVPVVQQVMGEAYPEIVERDSYITAIIRQEEESFHQTLEEGVRVAQKMLQAVQNKGGRVLPGEDAFLLYDTYGFPLDLARDMAEEAGLVVDETGFQQALTAQQERARRARGQDRSWEEQVSQGLNALLESLPSTEFVGYAVTETTTRLAALVAGDQILQAAEAGQEVGLVCESTPCYPEGGGQVGDTGTVQASHGRAAILDTRRLPGGIIAHRARVQEGRLEMGDAVRVTVDAERRRQIARHHSATHLLHRSLQEVLGPHARQAGSLVAADRLRFDFHHLSPLTPEEKRKIERLVNRQIMANLPVEVAETSYAAAREMGATALFGEKYGERVRVVSMGDFSRELCGGTHVWATGEIGFFRMVGETGIGSGLRRIEAVAGEAALEYVARREEIVEAVAGQLKTVPDEVPGKVEALLEELRAVRQQAEAMQARLARDQAAELAARARAVNGVKTIAAAVNASSPEGLRSLADQVRDRLGSGVVVLGTRLDGRVNFVTMVTPDWVKRGLHAGEIVREVARVAGGGGGGRPEMAQAGGKDPEQLQAALQAALHVVARQAGAARPDLS